MSDDVWVLGAAMTRIGRYPERDIYDLATQATYGALDDAGASIFDVGVLAAGSTFNPQGIGEGVAKQIGQTGMPIFNVTSACATGAVAARVAYLAIKAGEVDFGLAVGAEQMGKAGLLAFGKKSAPTFEPAGRIGNVMSLEGIIGSETMPAVFGQAGMEYAARHNGIGFEQFAKVAEKNHAHSALNPYSLYQKRFSLEEITNARMVSYPNNVLMCSPTGDGAAAVVLVSGVKLRSLSLEQRRRAVKISASVLVSDPWVESGEALPDVNTLTRRAADRAYELSGIGPQDLSMVELHDCFATAELLHYDNLRLCPKGGAGEFIDSGAPWHDGTLPVNVSGGLISKGHPIAMTGIAGICEVVTQLRGEAGDRQLDEANVGLTHVLGLGSSCGVHILEKPAA